MCVAAGRWELYTMSGRKDNGTLTGAQIPSGGEFVLGQSSRPGVSFDTTYALEGNGNRDPYNWEFPCKRSPTRISKEQEFICS